MFSKILVGIDGSPQSLRAAEVAGAIARMDEAVLYIVVAYEPLPRDLGESLLEPLISTRIMAADELYDLALIECGKIQGTIVKEIMEGPPAEAILAVAQTREVDLIVMGTRGLGKLASFVLGSQSMKVVSESTCPVLLVK